MTGATTKQEEIYTLTDVEVTRLGLVNRGANQEKFFLLKSADTMDDTDAVVTNLETKVTKSIWQKLVELIKGSLVEENVFTDITMTNTGNTDAVDTIGNTNAVDTTDTVTISTHKSDVLSTDITTVTTTITTDTAATAVITTNTTDIDIVKNTSLTPDSDSVVNDIPLVENITKEGGPMPDEVTINKADYDSLLVRLEKTEAELVKSNEEKERQTYIAKAQLYGYIPVATTELAEQLHWLAKSDSARATWWEDVLKAMDNMVSDSSMFSERGAVQMPTTALDSVMKSADPKTAVMGLPKHEAEAYLRKVRNGK